MDNSKTGTFPLWECRLVTMSKTRVLAEPPLIERERELQELDFFLNFAVKGKGKTIFVSGEVGSGKTRLVTEFLNGAKKTGCYQSLERVPQ